MEDLTNMRFGHWTVLGRSKQKYREPRWDCRCDCGTVKSVLGKYLRNGASTSCGCMRKVDLTGQHFGFLTVIQTLYGYQGYNHATYHCVCDCGNDIYIKGSQIYKVKSCGCTKNLIQIRPEYDITGQIFGRLTVLYPVKVDGKLLWECQCQCGEHITVSRSRLTSGNTRSCGCIHSPSLIGAHFGRLTVISEADRPRGSKQRWWNCLCDCGQTTVVQSYTLTSGHTASCGCLFSQSNSKGETLIAKILDDQNIEYKRQYKFDDCIGIGNKRLRFDFYIPSINTAIEYDGQQHFMPADYFGGEESYNRQKQNDEIKNKYCEENGINLVRLPYTLSNKKVEMQILKLLNS